MFMNIEELNLKMSLRPKRKKKPLFYGQRALPSRIGWWGRSFFNIFYLSGAIMTPPPKKNLKKILQFHGENFQKIFPVIFQNYFVRLWPNRLISQDFSKLKTKKEKPPKLDNLGWLGL